MAGQRQSSISTEVHQLDLLSAKKPSSAPVDFDYLAMLPNFRRAVRYSVSLADMEPKQVFEPLQMDKAIWSRIENGGMSFPADEIHSLAKITTNEAPLLWLCHRAGWDIRAMRKLRDDKERRIAELEAELAIERQEKAAIAKFVRETIR